MLIRRIFNQSLPDVSIKSLKSDDEILKNVFDSNLLCAFYKNVSKMSANNFPSGDKSCKILGINDSLSDAIFCSRNAAAIINSSIIWKLTFIAIHAMHCKIIF